MYFSRYHYGNGRISVALDSLTGELLEFIDEHSGENLIKNSTYTLPQPFWLLAKVGGETKKLFGGNACQISRDPLLKPVISAQEGPDGVVHITVVYTNLTDGKTCHAVHVAYTLCLPSGKSETVWTIEVEHQESDLTVQEVHFPCINGIYFGESWEDDTLVYPYHAGLRVPNPVGVFSGPHQITEWKWQEYQYAYERRNPSFGPDENGLYALECAYSGNLSMTWLDYYGAGTGFYFANHDPEPRICALRADTLGTGNPGMNFSFIHYPELEAGHRWASAELVAAVHEGDWHVGARRYRAFRKRHVPTIPSCPEWFEHSAGLMAHYDFKYQNGGTVHRYQDIPGLLDEARELGINHLLFAGWHRDGFDNGFPMYEPDDELGSGEELREGIANIRMRGGHVCFYINARLANMKYGALTDFIQDNVVILENGSAGVENYGNAELNFAVMCANSPSWSENLKSVLRWITEEIGVDGVYLDQLAMAPPCRCHNVAHGHAPDCWNHGYQALLAGIVTRYGEVQENARMSIIHEGVSDSYGGLSSGQLISTFMYFHMGAFPELYKYTFPEQILVDMLYPEKNMAMRPVHVGQVSKLLIDKAFVTGSYYWIYDLVDDNTFTRDARQYQYLKDTITLRTFWLDSFGQGIFRDTDSLSVRGSAIVKRFDFGQNRLFACARGRSGKASTVEIPDEGWETLLAYSVADNTVKREEVTLRKEGGALSVPLPDVPLCLLWASK